MFIFICLIGLTVVVKLSDAVNTTSALPKSLGAIRDIKDIKLCKIFKCLYVEMGCADSPLKKDDVLCRINLYENLKMTDTKSCPWRPCQGFDQPDHQVCLPFPCPELEVAHGLCGHNMHCCSSHRAMSNVIDDNHGLRQPESTTASYSDVRHPVYPGKLSLTPHATVGTDTPKCLIPEFPNRRCVLGAFCSFDPAVKLVPHHACPDPEELCCESLL
ncbi:hypothetical protein Btru_019162 [Bulinus truncatus]|nr:hypothetical protein Btru_019162 [Bulinus truncatus]